MWAGLMASTIACVMVEEGDHKKQKIVVRLISMHISPKNYPTVTGVLVTL